MVILKIRQILILVLLVFGAKLAHSEDKSTSYRPMSVEEFIQTFEAKSTSDLMSAMKYMSQAAELRALSKCPCVDLVVSTTPTGSQVQMIDNCKEEDNERKKSKSNP